MNKFIGGSFDGQDFPVEEYETSVFYAVNIGNNTKEEYLKNEIERNGRVYTFWILKELNNNLAEKQIDTLINNTSF